MRSFTADGVNETNDMNDSEMRRLTNDMQRDDLDLGHKQASHEFK